jgi:ABC-2 type transport system ATP-binding protein
MNQIAKPIITVENLTKHYGSSRGIEDVSFEIAEGEVFGFLGPNGAGKTTTMRTLMGLLHPASGKATIGGYDCWTQATEAKRLVGYLPGEFAFDPALTGAQIIQYLGNLRGNIDEAYVKQLVDRLGLDLSKKFRAYSRGNKQKVGVIQAFMHKPPLLILDEPTGGLDPLNQQEFYKIVQETHANGQTVFLSSHILPEVEHTCERVGIIRDGRLVQVDRVSALKALQQRQLEITFAGPASPEWFAQVPGVLSVGQGATPQELHMAVHKDIAQVIQVAAQHGATNILTREPSLEEIFLHFYEPDKAPRATEQVALAH